MIGIVTGASSGIGALFVESLLRRYPKLEEIWVVARRRDRLEVLAERYPGKIRPVVADLSREHETKILQTLLETEKPKVKFLVNAAGIGKIGDFMQIPLEDVLPMISINIQGLTTVTHEVIPYMVRNSRILQVASVAAFVPQPGFSVYAATKAYVLSLSCALSRELAEREITVTAVCPGPMQTEFFLTAETYGKMNPFKMHFMYDPKAVVEHAMDAAVHKKKLAVYGLSMKALGLCTKLLPTEWLLDIMDFSLPTCMNKEKSKQE